MRAWPLLLVGPVAVAIRFSFDPQSWIVGIVAIGLLAQVTTRWRDLFWSRELVFIGGFVLWAVVSLVWSPDAQRGIRIVVSIAAAGLAYLLGSVSKRPGGGSRIWQIGTAGLLLGLASVLLVPNPPPINALNADRMLGMGAIAMAVSAWYGPRSRTYIASIGLIALILGVFSGSRMASFVLLILMLTTPGLRLPKAGRTIAALLVTSVFLLASTTDSFRERWSESDEGGILAIMTFQDLDSSGRFEVWPEIVGACGRTILGNGVGAADAFGVRVKSAFPEPHNEYLRVWCDAGIPGLLLFWGFVVSVAARARSALGVRNRARWVHIATLQMAVALAFLSLTDNPLTTTIPFLIPAALIFGWSSSARDS